MLLALSSLPFSATAENITGTVTDSGGNPLQGINVYATLSTASWWSVASATTDAAGAYDLGGLTAGTYRVEFRDWNGAYVGEYYNDAATWDSATDIAVTAGGTASGINAQLAAAGHITGTVTDAGGTPLQNIFVYASRWNGTDWGDVSSAYTDTTGAYDIGGLTAGTYRVSFLRSSTYLGENYNDAATWDSATDIAVTAGGTVSGIDAQLAAAGHITGTVTDAGGTPLQNIGVAAYRWNGTDWGYAPYAYAYTDAAGAYDIGGLSTGTYRVWFSGGSAYAGEYYNDAATPDSATDIAVTAGGTASGINAQLATPGHITGTVTDASGNPLQNIDVTAYRWNGTWWDYATDVNTDAAGVYDIGGLSTGVYRVEFQDWWNGVYLSEYYNDATTLDSATDLAVTAGGTTSGIDAQLASAGHITGTVTDAGGTPLQNIGVFAHRWNGTDWEYVSYAYTNAAGAYDLGGLATGTYRVYFGGYDYLGEYYNDATTLDSATDIAVTAGSTLAGIDAQLAAAGHITGSVTDSGGNPLQEIDVFAYRWNGTDWDYASYVYTDATGAYYFGGLTAGTYRVEFMNWNGAYAGEYYNDATTLDTATDIAVTAGGTVAGIDAQLASAGHITGSVTDSGGNPLQSIYVRAYRWNGTDWDYASYAYTDAAGAYNLSGLATGTYRVGFIDGSNAYLSEYYNDATTLDTATDLAVTAGSTVSGISVQLAAPGEVPQPPPLPPRPAAPTDLSAAPGVERGTVLAWSDNASDEIGYRVERSLDNGATWTEIAVVPADGTAYADLGACGMGYQYRVKAFNGGGASAPSNVASATAPACPKDDPVLMVNIAGQGAITSQPAGIDCGNLCNQTFPADTLVTLIAAPAAGYRFAGWNNPACAAPLMLEIDTTCAATFVAAPGGGGTDTGGTDTGGTDTGGTDTGGTDTGGTDTGGTDTGGTPTPACVPNSGAHNVVQGLDVPSAACFGADVRTAHGRVGNPLMVLQDESVELAVRIHADPQHLGRAADLLLLANYRHAGSVAWYVRAGQGWQAWDGSLDLPAAGHTDALPQDLTLPVFAGALQGYPGRLTVYAGYRLADGTLVHNVPAPLRLTVANALLYDPATGARQAGYAYFDSVGRAGNAVGNPLHVAAGEAFTLASTVYMPGLGAGTLEVAPGAFVPATPGQASEVYLLPWNSAEALSLGNGLGLGQDRELPLFQGSLPEAGEYEAYLGYRLPDGRVMYNGLDAIRVSVY